MPAVLVFPSALAPHSATPVSASVAQGWHGDRYWDGQRYWSRNEWEEHQRHRDHDRDAYRLRPDAHCPPGHAKKGEC